MRFGSYLAPDMIFESHIWLFVYRKEIKKSKKESLDRQLDKEIRKAEQEIDLLKKNAPEKINKIAIETSAELVKKLIGAEVNNSSISAIVDDLSKRNGDKYYGN